VAVATATDAALSGGSVGVFLGGDNTEALLEQVTLESAD
jgi:hypothetical protein